MKIRTKFTLMVGVPIVALVVILIVGYTSFNKVEYLVSDLSVLQDERATMIDADRDAYQAFLAELYAISAVSAEDVQAEQESNTENIQQTWDRITGPGQNFAAEMMPVLDEFKSYYNTWRPQSERVIQLASETVTGNMQRLEASQAAVAAFGSMRDQIDVLGEYVGTLLEENISLSRRRDLENALSLVLNGDRDAYQAYVAQLLALEATSEAELIAIDETSAENIAQTKARVTEGADIAGGDAAQIKTAFLGYFEAWESNSRRVIQLSRENFAKNATIASLEAQNEASFGSMRDTIDRMGELQKERVQADVVELQHQMDATVLAYVIIAAIGIIFTVVFVAITAVRITRSLLKGVSFADEIAQGDLTVNLDIEQNDEIGRLASSLTNMVNTLRYKADLLDQIADGNLAIDVEEASGKDQLGLSLRQMSMSLRDLVTQITRSVDEVRSGADQVSQSSQALSQGATEQASSLEEISSAINEVGGQSQQNAENAKAANGIAQDAMGKARSGNEQMTELNDAMALISDSSVEINKVVKVIDDIAFQINLLALNANVEAARAGKFGKGFAVVAEEVRTLAVRSAQAVKDTTAMVEGNQKNIEAGNAAAELTTRHLGEIVDGVGKVAGLLGEISAASSEQAQAILQITNGLEQIDQVTQANTASAEESASASEELTSQAEQLRQMTRQFKLNGSAEEEQTEELVEIMFEEEVPQLIGN